MKTFQVGWLVGAILLMNSSAFPQEPARTYAQAVTSKTGAWTYPGTGTVNTYWIETPGGGLVVIDVQRDLKHAAQALEAIKAVGKPVRAILITHAHPDHYTGIGLFKAAFPGAVVYSSQATADAIRYLWRQCGHETGASIFANLSRHRSRGNCERRVQR